MKILFASSKEMNLDNLIETNNNINFELVNKNIDFIKNIKQEDCFNIFKTKEDIYLQNQNIDIYSKKAIELFNGISFRQLELDNLALFNDVLIFSALYGCSYASDMISPFRYDYTMKNSKTYRKEIYFKINELLEKEDIVYNLSSKEFSNGIVHNNVIEFSFYLNNNGELKQHSVASKKNRGAMLMHFVKGLKIEDYQFEGYAYNEELSNENEYVFIKQD
ncbi:MAG: peroxide stress protein YaaA [Erysipelotrichales bacterium]